MPKLSNVYVSESWNFYYKVEQKTLNVKTGVGIDLCNKKYKKTRN